MEKLPMCRICLVQNVRMYIVVNRNLHQLYEKLTDIPFVTEDRRPILSCFICITKLKQCCQFLRNCLKAEEQFAQMMSEDYEPNPLINQDCLEFYSGFIKSPIDHISIGDECHTESIAIKEELPAFCEGLDDIIEPKEELQSDELEPENLDNSRLSRCSRYTPPHHPESDSEDDLPLMEFKTEVVEEDVSKKKRPPRETKNDGEDKDVDLTKQKVVPDYVTPEPLLANSHTHLTTPSNGESEAGRKRGLEYTLTPTTPNKRRKVSRTHAVDETPTIDWDDEIPAGVIACLTPRPPEPISTQEVLPVILPLPSVQLMKRPSVNQNPVPPSPDLISTKRVLRVIRLRSPVHLMKRPSVNQCPVDLNRLLVTSPANSLGNPQTSQATPRLTVQTARTYAKTATQKITSTAPLLWDAGKVPHFPSITQQRGSAHSSQVAVEPNPSPIMTPDTSQINRPQGAVETQKEPDMAQNVEVVNRPQGVAPQQGQGGRVQDAATYVSVRKYTRRAPLALASMGRPQ